MPEIEVNGEKKKVACGPCIRGHRSSKCTHKDRVLIEVRKPGRPLSACPHPTGSCSCERVVLNYTIPKTSECSCAAPQSTASGPSASRVQKGKGRKAAASTIRPSNLERALSGASTNVSQSGNSSMSPEAKATSGSSCCGGNDAPDDVAIKTDHESPADSLSSNVANAETARNSTNPSSVHPDRLAASVVQQRTLIPGSGSSPYGHEVQFQQNTKIGGFTEATNNGRPLQAAPTNSVGPSCCSTRRTSLSLVAGQAEATPSDGTTLTSHQPANRPGNDMIPFNGPISGQIPHSISNTQVSGHLSGNSVGPAVHQFGHIETPFRVTSHGLEIVDPSAADFMHTCTCGDGCACLACLTHPYNKTTLEYVRYHTDLSMKFGGVGGLEAQPNLDHISHMLTNKIQSSSQAVNMFGQPKQTHQDPVAAWMLGPSNISHTAHTQPQWRDHQHVQATPTQELEHLQLKAQPQDIANQGQDSTAHPAATIQGSDPFTGPKTPVRENEAGLTFEQNSPHNSDDVSILSPGAFFLQSYVIPGCDDATGTCQCGDGCSCPGCLTHSGHQPTPLPQTDLNPYPSHGAGCACPHDEPIQTAPNANASLQYSSPAFSQYQHQNTTAPDTSQRPNGHIQGPVTGPSSTNTTTSSHIHGPTCACPDSAVMQAQAQVQAHAQLHGADCQCATGQSFVKAQLEAEARAYTRMHGAGCRCPGHAEAQAVPGAATGWIGGPG